MKVSKVIYPPPESSSSGGGLTIDPAGLKIST